MLTYYIDGSYCSQTVIGAYGYCIKHPEGTNVVVHTSGLGETTNNRMELCALIATLRNIAKRNLESKDTTPIPAVVYCDSKYVIDGLNLWLPAWEKNGYRTAQNKPVKNVDLWKTLKAASKGVSYELRWVKGHGDCKEHNLIDAELAKVTKKKS